MSLNFILLLTLLLLFVPFFIYFKSSKRKGKKQLAIACLIYLVIASPVIYGVLDNKIMQYEDANIGLGLSFFLTWFLTICLLAASLVFGFKMKKTS